MDADREKNRVGENRADAPDLLSIRDLRISFHLPEGTIQAVKGINFRIPPGKTVALVGESGSGKSVVSQAIMGILPKTAKIDGGKIDFCDEAALAAGAPVDIAKLNRNSANMRKIRGGRISIIFQEPMTSLSPLHTVGDQIIEALELHRSERGKASEKLAQDMLAMVGFPDPERALKTYPFELSGGLRQRAMIAMALVCRPALLIADEPTTALDVTIQAQILKLIRDLQEELGMAVLIITHDLGVVANVADEIVVMYHGEIMEAGTKEDIFNNPQHPYLKALLKAVPRFDMEPGERLVPIREIKSKTGHLLKMRDAVPIVSDYDAPILKVEGLTKTYTIKKGGFLGAKKRNQVRAVDHVSFEIPRGKCLGLVGESGCGKTTLSKILMRALSPDEGTVTFHDGGVDLDVLSLSRDALIPFRRKMQFIFQDPFSSLNPRMTVFDIITEPLVIHKVGDRTEQREMAAELMELVGLDVRHLNRYPHSFSGGQRQRIGIARALALKPELLICDEPVSALDVSIQAQILNLLKDLQAKLGLSYLFISHNLAVVDYIADDIAVMCRGRLVEHAPRELLFRNPMHPYTKGLLAAVPEPSLDKPLDFAHLMNEKASIPDQWPAPFTDLGDGQNRMVDMGNGHFVRVQPEAASGALVA
ncbi:peptide/nickel transport system ATP-binding protein [Aestuariispira insulae]|uniref:Peptide/nickel transport system ATP-binding protein n=2 Tax=Aestuariispira insulae TaxID=1461337 RepID=A0A3D9HPK3_9PROT|nr:peptide/nickel transport system ATP-binding protein [Aestuariispira insulae]